MNPRHTPIPRVFRQVSGESFQSCLICHRDLVKSGSDYLIEKAVRNYPEVGHTEVIFEYAMCFECAMNMRDELSEESRFRIDQYFAENMNREARRNRLESNERNHVSRWLSHCLVKNTPVKVSREYSLYAHCRGNQMIYSELPYALSGEVLDEVMQLLSNKSLDILDDFLGKHFGGPPEVREILKRRPILV